LRRLIMAMAIVAGTLAGCSSQAGPSVSAAGATSPVESSGQATDPTTTAGPAFTSTFPGHTCIVTDKLESETLAVTPTEEKYDSSAQNVCQQLFGAPMTHASGIPNGYELRCTGTGYGLIARIYTRPNAKDDCQELATAGYKVVQSS
jgi:hypothetical protein